MTMHNPPSLSEFVLNILKESDLKPRQLAMQKKIDYNYFYALITGRIRLNIKGAAMLTKVFPKTTLESWFLMQMKHEIWCFTHKKGKNKCRLKKVNLKK